MRFLRPLACALAVLPLSACLTFKQDVARLVTGETPAIETEPAWGPSAEKLEWHPASRVRADGKKWVLDARVRLVDGLNDYTKVSGAWHFELHAVSGLVEGRYDLLRRWDDKVTEFAQHKAHFDPATRSYRFILELDAPPPDDKPLRALVVFTPEGGERMGVETEL